MTKNVTSQNCKSYCEDEKMSMNNQKGFSLIELLLVVTIIGTIAALGVPSLQRGIRAADNGAAFAQMRVLSSAQVAFYSNNGRFGRLAEINASQGGGFGTTTGGGASLTKGRFVYEMSPLTPTDAELRDGYVVTANGINGVGGTPYIFRVNQTGEIVQVSP
jgi:prepilin-type N-terminal cleavage/methylation domain-containing protein